MSSSRLASRALGVLLAPALVIAALAAAPPGSADVGPDDVLHTFPSGLVAAQPLNPGPAVCGGSPVSPIQFTYNVAGLGNRKLSDVRLGIDLNHTWGGDYHIEVVAPDGTVGTVTDPDCAGGVTDNTDIAGFYYFNNTGTQTFAQGLSALPDASVLSTGVNWRPIQDLATRFAHLANPNGTWTVRIWDEWGGATGTAGPNANLWLRVDHTRPTTEIVSGPADGSPAGEVEFVLGGTDNMGVTAFNCSLDGATPVACTSPYTTTVAAGAHSLSVTAVDASGNSDLSPAIYTWETAAAPDTTPPNTNITGGPADGDTVSVLPSYSFSSPDADTTGYECSLDGGAYAACTSPYMTPGGTAPGAHTFAVRAKDGAGNVDPTPATRGFTYDPTPDDTTPPQTNIIGGPENGAGVKSPPTYRFASPDADADGFVCSVDNKAFKPCTTPFTVSGIAPGNHSFEVAAVDEAGNVDPTPAMRTFKLRDLCAEAKAKLRQARQKLRQAIEDGAGPRKIRRLRGQVKKWKAQVADLC